MSVFQGPAAHQWYSAAWKLRVELAGAEDTPVWREVLVPESMPLRILRYVIDQLFSLSPTPEYQFSIPEEEFIRQTDDRFTEYCRLCGARFRFPTIRDEESCCGEEEVDPKEWLRRRYRGSYTYHGNADHLVENQQAVRNFLMVFTGLRESPVIDLNEYRRGEVKVEKTKRAPAASLTMREVLEAELFKTHPNQVLERLRIPEVLFLDRKKAPAPNLPEPEEFYPELLWGGYFDRCFARLERIHQRSMEAVRIHHELMDRHVRLDEDMDEETELNTQLSLPNHFGRPFIALHSTKRASCNKESLETASRIISKPVVGEVPKKINRSHKTLDISIAGRDLAFQIGARKTQCIGLVEILDDTCSPTQRLKRRILAWTQRKLGSPIAYNRPSLQ